MTQGFFFRDLSSVFTHILIFIWTTPYLKLYIFIIRSISFLFWIDILFIIETKRFSLVTAHLGW